MQYLYVLYAHIYKTKYLCCTSETAILRTIYAVVKKRVANNEKYVSLWSVKTLEFWLDIVKIHYLVVTRNLDFWSSTSRSRMKFDAHYSPWPLPSYGSSYFRCSLIAEEVGGVLSTDLAHGRLWVIWVFLDMLFWLIWKQLDHILSRLWVHFNSDTSNCQ